MDAFFDARAREIVSGGLMAISTICLPDGEGACWSQTGIGMIIDLLGSCLVDMANKGLISQDKLESFYLPVYHCKVEELESLISRNGCFSIQKTERMPPSLPWNSPEIIQLMLPSLRAGFEILITQHFRITSPSTVDLLFDHLAEKFSQNMSAITSIPTTLQHLEAFILAKRV
ncbi:Loganic acid O-methyltransferase [Linum perenne]